MYLTPIHGVNFAQSNDTPNWCSYDTPVFTVHTVVLLKQILYDLCSSQIVGLLWSSEEMPEEIDNVYSYQVQIYSACQI